MYNNNNRESEQFSEGYFNLYVAKSFEMYVGDSFIFVVHRNVLCNSTKTVFCTFAMIFGVMFINK